MSIAQPKPCVESSLVSALVEQQKQNSKLCEALLEQQKQIGKLSDELAEAHAKLSSRMDAELVCSITFLS